MLVNPGVPLSTAEVFRALAAPRRETMPAATAPSMLADRQALVTYVAGETNDLEPVATRLCPPIASVLDAIAAQHGALLARMSGSGPTCFGLFASDGDAAEAANRLRQLDRRWWVTETTLG